MWSQPQYIILVLRQASRPTMRDTAQGQTLRSQYFMS